MRTTLATLACAVLLGWTSSSSRSTAEDPPLRISVRIDGVEHHVEDGEEFTVVVGGKEVRAGVSVHPCRRFEHAGIRFDFPRDMAFAHEESEGVSLWTLDGNDSILHVQAFESGDASELARTILMRMQHAIDADALPARAHGLELGGETHAGLRARAHMAEAGVTFELTAVGLGTEDRPVVLVLQDTLGDDGESTAESLRILELLRDSFAASKTD